MKDKTIAVTFQNMVQFYSLKNGLDYLINKGYVVDIYVPTNNDNIGFAEMFNETYSLLVNLGYSPLRDLDNSKTYKILLEPYPMDIYYKFNFQYRIKYKYAPIAAKPNLTCNPENNIYYDAILCYGPYDADYLKVYANTYIIGNLKYINYTRNATLQHNKPVLLYLPTYGTSSSIDDVIDALKALQKDYYIITKFHHGTSYLQDEKNRIEKIKSISNEYYDHSTQLIDLLAKTHVVLSDNSGAIFESLYASVPVAVFTDDLNKNKLGSFDTTQYEIVHKDFIPFTSNPSEISKILEKAMSEKYIEKQKRLKDILFYNSSNPVEDFANVIESYLNDNINLKYKALHDILIEDYSGKINLINNLYSQIQNLNQNLDNMQTVYNQNISDLKKDITQKDKILSYYENGKLYKLANSIYKKYHKLIGKGKNYE